MERLKQCHLCTSKCPQEELACEIAKGRMYATKELIECKKELAEARNKAIDEFYEKLCNELTERATEIKTADGVLYDILTVDDVSDIVMDIAERMKGEEHE